MVSYLFVGSLPPILIFAPASVVNFFYHKNNRDYQTIHFVLKWDYEGEKMAEIKMLDKYAKNMGAVIINIDEFQDPVAEEKLYHHASIVDQTINEKLVNVDVSKFQQFMRNIPIDYFLSYTKEKTVQDGLLYFTEALEKFYQSMDELNDVKRIAMKTGYYESTINEWKIQLYKELDKHYEKLGKKPLPNYQKLIILEAIISSGNKISKEIQEKAGVIINESI